MNNKIRILSTVGIYHAFNDGAVVIIPILFPVFKVLFDLSYTQIGIITGGGLLIMLITQISIGFLSDKKNRRMLLSLGVLFYSASLLLLTQVKGFLTLLVFLFLLRFSAAFFHPVGIGWISKIFKKEKLDWAMGIQSALGDFGAFIGILTTAFIVDFKDWSYPFYIWAIIGVICLFIGLSLTRGVKEETNNNENNKKKKLPFKERLIQEKEILKTVKFFIPGLIIGGSAWGIVVTYLPLLLAERTVLSLSLIGVIVSIWIGIGTIVCFLYGRIISFFGRKKVIIFSYIGMGLMGFSLSIFTEIYILIIIMVILGLSTFLTYPAIFSYVSEKTHESFEGKVFGYLFTVQLGGAIILLFISGVTSDIWGIWTPFFILGILSSLIAILFIGNHKKLTPLKH